MRYVLISALSVGFCLNLGSSICRAENDKSRDILTESERSVSQREKFEELARVILASSKKQAVSVGVFSPTGLSDTNSGQGIEESLKVALNAVQPGSVSDEALLIVKGDYGFAKSRLSEFDGQKVIKIKARIINKEFDDVLVEINREVIFDASKTIAQMLQPNVLLNPEGTKEERNKAIDEAVKAKAKGHIHGPDNTLISSSPQSQVDVTVLVKPLKDHEKLTAKPRTATLKNGLPFVDIERDELYELRVANRSKREIAVKVFIDGIDMFHFSKDRQVANDPHSPPKFTHLILAKESAGTVFGWHNKLEGTENYRSFLVTANGKGAISEAGIKARGDVGVIHVQISYCKEIPAGGKAAAGNETGFGPNRTVQQKAVSYEIEPPFDFISVRYNRD